MVHAVFVVGEAAARSHREEVGEDVDRIADYFALELRQANIAQYSTRCTCFMGAQRNNKGRRHRKLPLLLQNLSKKADFQ